MVQRQLFGVAIKDLSRDQRPEFLSAEHQRNGEVHEAGAIPAPDAGTLEQSILDAAARLQGLHRERALRLRGRLSGVEKLPKRLRIQAGAEQAPVRIHE